MATKDDRLFAFAYSNPQVAALYSELHEDMNDLGANCLEMIPSPWVDYGDEEDFYPTPTAVEAVTMCSGCPVVEACFEYAKLYRPNHGVWGGILWRNGKGRGIKN
jgi:hypothetical protein